MRTKDGAFAGRAGIRHIPVDGMGEIEIARALTEIGLSRLQLPSLIGLVFVGHRASCRVLEKANYVLEKTATHQGEEVVIYRTSRRRRR